MNKNKSIDRIKALWHFRKHAFIWTTAIILSGGIGLLSFWPRTYFSSTTLLILSEGSRPMGIGDLMRSGLALSIGGGLLSSPSQQKLVNILTSRALAEKVVDSTNLIEFTYGSDLSNLEEKRSGLARVLQSKKINVEMRKPGLLEIYVRHETPELAFRITTAYVENLRSFLKGTTLTMGQKTRTYLETETAQALAELNNFRDRLRDYQSKHKMISAQSSLQNIHSSHQALLGNLVEVETNERFLQKYLTPDNPYLKSEQQRSRALRNQIVELERGAFAGTSDKKSPSTESRAVLDYVSLEREVLIKQMIYEGLLRELQVAKIEANREDLSFEVLDSPLLYKKPVSPNYMVGSIGILGLLLLAYAVIIWDFFSRHKVSLAFVEPSSKTYASASAARPS